MKFLADENFNGKIVNALRREYPEIVIIRVQDTVMYQSPDPDLLAWASDEGYILLTHDVKTMPTFANARLADGLFLSGVIIVRNSLPFRQVIDDLLTIAQASHADEWINKVTFLPL